MFKDDYRKELNKISASEKFRQDTISLMQEKQAVMEQSNKKQIHFKAKPTARIAASVAVLTLALGAYAFSQSDFAVSADNEGAGAPVREQITDYDVYDSLHPGYDKKYWLTIDDREDIEKSASPAVHNEAARISLNIFNHGMGYEAHMVYGPSELECNPEYTLGNKFDSLPVYKFTPLSAEDALTEAENILYDLNAEASDIVFTWSKPVYNEEGIHYTNEEIRTDDAKSPGDEYNLSYIDGNITIKNGVTGLFSLWATRGMMRVEIDEPVADSEKPEAIFAGVKEKYPQLFDDENTDFFSWYDYMYFAEKNYTNIIYNKTEDWRQNIFNVTMNSMHVDIMTVSSDNPVYDQTSIWFPLPYYAKEENLPAITYQQALGLLFNGQFYSSKTDTIPQDAVVMHTELVYYPPEYKMTIPGYEGYSLPFYKFYIEDPEQQRKTLGGILKEYYICYVCALDPSFVNLTGDYGIDNIVQFNGAPVN